MSDDDHIMPLYDENMCPVCFYDATAFKFCCDSGKAHREILCQSCNSDLLSTTKPVSKFCTSTGQPHKDPRHKEVTPAALAEEKCPFCGYEKTVHKHCTETGWLHSDLSAQCQTYRANAKAPAKTANGVVTPRASTQGTPQRGTPQVREPSPSTPEAKRPKLSVPAQPTPTSSPPPASPTPVPSPKTPNTPATKQITDSTFLMSGITPEMKILFVGEGNFSFSRAIGKRVFGDRPWRNMVATDLEMLAGKDNPGHNLTASNAIELLKRQATVAIGVDATKISECLPWVQPGSFDLITFQFPHNADKNFPFYPFPKGVPLESVAQHRDMLGGFLKQCAIMLKEGGRACITTKTSEPYKSWEVDMLAEPPMWFSKGDVFDEYKWSQTGYSHINTINKCNTSISGALTYIFIKDSHSHVAESK